MVFVTFKIYVLFSFCFIVFLLFYKYTKIYAVYRLNKDISAIIEQVNVMIPTNRRVTIDKVAHHLRISYDFAYEIIQNKLGFR